jgi:hypothetical protein
MTAASVVQHERAVEDAGDLLVAKVVDRDQVHEFAA